MGTLDFGPLTDYRAPFDEVVYHALNGLPPVVQWCARFCSDRRVALLGIIAAFGAILVHHRRRAFRPLLAAALALAAADLIGARLLKPLFHRQRPCFCLPPGSFHRWIEIAHSGSMPSLHAANSFALAFVLARTVPRLALWGYAAAIFVSLSRISLGVHWPSDVLAGAVLGTVMGSLSLLAVARL